jgi:hypothetical protein
MKFFFSKLNINKFLLFTIFFHIYFTLKIKNENTKAKAKDFIRPIISENLSQDGK